MIGLSLSCVQEISAGRLCDLNATTYQNCPSEWRKKIKFGLNFERLVDFGRSVEENSSLMSKLYSGCKATQFPTAVSIKIACCKSWLMSTPEWKSSFNLPKRSFWKWLVWRFQKATSLGGAQMQDSETGEWKKTGGAPLFESIGGTLTRLNEEKFS